MKVLFVKEKTSWVGVSNLSLALGILGTILKNSGHQVKLLDNNSGFVILSERKILEAVKEFKPDVIMFSLSPLNASRSYDLVKIIKCIYPDIPVVAGGIHMKYCYKEAIRFGFDMVVRGEAETIIDKLVDIALSFRDKKEYSDKLSRTPFIAYPGMDEKSLETVGFPPLLKNLDEVPFVDYDLFQIQHYKVRGGYDTAIFNTLYTQRGCPYGCTFCSDEIQKKSVRFSSAKYMFDNLRHYYEYSGNKSFYFCDNVFTLSRPRVVEFSRLMQESGLNKEVSFVCQTNVLANIDEETVYLLKQAGCRSVSLGIERFVEESRFKMNKRFTEKRLDDVVGLFKKIGVGIDYFILVGLPFDTQELLEKEKEAFHKYEDKLDYPIAQTLMPMPGTIYYDNYPKTKEWYLNKRYISDIYSLYSGIYDMRFYLSYKKSNFYNMPK
ncbi:MAG: B12-binding domain-containing radical SAM protein, partial [Candidatus Omnitrophica bacterium]|nr:B12-binding domain-containing radical SAM protein [Candidatus Omnitrophota bacterium]